MDYNAEEQLAAQAIGTLVLRHMRGGEIAREIAEIMNSRAIQTLERIRDILNDDALDDPDCFHRIEAIVRALEDSGITTFRHDW